MKLQDQDFVNIEPADDDEVSLADVSGEFLVAVGGILLFLAYVALAASWQPHL